MVNVIHHTEQVARKEYFDDGSDFMVEAIGGRHWTIGYTVGSKGFSPTVSELRTLVKFKNSNTRSKILPGERYIRQFNNYDGHTYTWRMKLDIYELACKYQLFPEI